MGIFYILQLFIAGLVWWGIRKQVHIFGNDDHPVSKVRDDTSGLFKLHAHKASAPMQATLGQINDLLLNRQRRDFYNSTFSIEMLIDQLFDNIRSRVQALISLHVVVALVGTFWVVFSLYSDVTLNLLSLQSDEDAFAQLAVHIWPLLTIVLFTSLITGVVMSVEWAYWQWAQHQMNAHRLRLIAFIDQEFQDSATDSLRAVLNRFSEVQRKLNTQWEERGQQLDHQLEETRLALHAQAGFAQDYTSFLKTLKQLDPERRMVDALALAEQLDRSMVLVQQHLPRFADLTAALDRTLNRSTQLYTQLNAAIERDGQFRATMEVYNEGVKHNGHLTTQLLETLQRVQTHLNQVVLTHGPQIEALDKQFFDYLEKRLAQLQRALEHNDAQLFALLARSAEATPSNSSPS